MSFSLSFAHERFGQIEVEERIEIYPPGRVLGNVKTPIFIIKEGAVFEGTSRMDNSKINKYKGDSKSIVLEEENKE